MQRTGAGAQGRQAGSPRQVPGQDWNEVLIRTWRQMVFSLLPIVGFPRLRRRGSEASVAALLLSAADLALLRRKDWRPW